MNRVARIALLICVGALVACEKSPSEPSKKASEPKEPSAAPSSAGLAVHDTPSRPLAFPDAEGFGAYAAGGRGGSICSVTSLAKSGEGSLASCIQKPGPRVVVFRTSGVIEGPVEITHGHLTIAGQTSPSGIVIRGGLVCTNDCNDVVIRHLRVRGGEGELLHATRAHNLLVDRCSFENGNGEQIAIRDSSDVTIQFSIVAEPLGEKKNEHGVLIEGSDNISIHHTLFDGVSRHVPKIACEARTPDSACRGRTIHAELTNNVIWEGDAPIEFSRCTDAPFGNDCAESPNDAALALNLASNLFVRRGHAREGSPLIEPSIWKGRGDIFYSENRVQRGIGITPFGGEKPSRHSRHDFPYVTVTPNDRLISSLVAAVGAVPRDQMDARIVSHLSHAVDLLTRPEKSDAFNVDPKPTAAPKDSDGDGVPDDWERAHKTDPARADADAGTGAIPGCSTNVSVLECYLNELGARR